MKFRKVEPLPDAVVPLPVICCSECLTAYDLFEWRVLQLTTKRGWVEHRRCRGEGAMGPCREVLELDVEDLCDRDWWMSVSEYEQMFPGSDRVRLRRFELTSNRAPSGLERLRNILPRALAAWRALGEPRW